jgi:hypothetical protein
LGEKVQNLVRNNKLQKWFISPTQDFQQLILVVVRVPDLDRGSLAPKNVLAVIDVNSSGLYLLGTKEGPLEWLYARCKLTSAENLIRHMKCPEVHYLFRQPQ